ncbi:hypothetical protein ACFWPU_15420 [Streptomyces sp. NPDC058471]|uniref:hypothetical protein n=1 Tax=Streptomyces sp. NPDC058471 TaxID=3346516 RepID=UPI00365FA7CD
MDWYPSPDENVLLRTAAKFASGMASPVDGLRWFRDPERGDIQEELMANEGWPPAPAYELRTTGDRAARGALHTLFVGIPFIANLIANLGGASGAPFGDVPVRGRVEDPPNEVKDFPVMWAAPGALARTAPWQLDPARRPKGYATDLVLTDHRLLFLGTRWGTLDKAEVLGEFPRESIAEARQMKFSEINADVRITFTDGSWVRLFTGTRDSAERLDQVLSGAVVLLPESELSDGQRTRVARFMGELPRTAHPPTYTVLRSGIVLVESRVSVRAGSGVFETHSILMDDTGRPAEPSPGDL